MHAQITVETAVVPTPRVEQVAGLFDLPLEKTSRVTWNVTLPLEARPWHVGLVVGPFVRLFRFRAVNAENHARAGVSTKPLDGVLVEMELRGPGVGGVRQPDAAVAPPHC